MKKTTQFYECDLDEYDRFLLNALLRQEAGITGKKLSTSAKKQLTEAFIYERIKEKQARTSARCKATKARNARVKRMQNDTSFQWKPSPEKRK